MVIHHELSAKSDRIFYLPNDLIALQVWVKNNSQYDMKIKDFVLEFTDGENVRLDSLDFVLYSNSNQIVSDIAHIQLYNQYGNKKFRLSYNIYLFDNDWFHYTRIKSQEEFFLNIVTNRELNSNRFVVFLSRGRMNKDRIIGDIIKTRLKEWNIDTITVGIDLQSSNEQTLKIIRQKIFESQGLIAIATPRNYDIITQTWRTLEWLHAELGIAFAINIPLLIIKETDTELRGLPDYLINYGDIPSFSYDLNEKENLIYNIDRHMPFFREWLKKNQDGQFFDGVKEFAKISLAIVGGIVLIKNLYDGFTSKS